jgi:hypothetical protein
MPSEELGGSANRKFDMEAWMPGRRGWGEVRFYLIMKVQWGVELRLTVILDFIDFKLYRLSSQAAQHSI